MQAVGIRPSRRSFAGVAPTLKGNPFHVAPPLVAGSLPFQQLRHSGKWATRPIPRPDSRPGRHEHRSWKEFPGGKVQVAK